MSWKGDADMRSGVEGLIQVKSIVTIILTLVFAALSLKQIVNPEQFLMIFTTVIAFYFGTQHEKRGNDK